MNIEVTKKQNIRVDGVKYKAVPRDEVSCHNCAFFAHGMNAACRAAPCGSGTRKEGVSVSFVRKAPKWIPVKGVIPKLDPKAKIMWRNREGGEGTTVVSSLNWAIGHSNEITFYQLVKDAA